MSRAPHALHALPAPAARRPSPEALAFVRALARLAAAEDSAAACHAEAPSLPRRPR